MTTAQHRRLKRTWWVAPRAAQGGRGSRGAGGLELCSAAAIRAALSRRFGAARGPACPGQGGRGRGNPQRTRVGAAAAPARVQAFRRRGGARPAWEELSCEGVQSSGRPGQLRLGCRSFARRARLQRGVAASAPRLSRGTCEPSERIDRGKAAAAAMGMAAGSSVRWARAGAQSVVENDCGVGRNGAWGRSLATCGRESGAAGQNLGGQRQEVLSVVRW